MTEDHLFPSGLVSPGQRRVTKILHTVDPNFRGRQGSFLAQNGVKKATLCADCNNRVLGIELDPYLIAAYSAASSALESARFPVVGDLKLFNINLNRVARAVAGHMMALDDKPLARHTMARQLRRFVLQEQCGLDPSLRFLMWLYPFKRQGMLKDLHHAEFGKPYEPMWISAFKTYPLAFAFSTEIQNPNYRLAGVIDLTRWVTTDVEQHFNIRVPARPIVDSNWPFAPHPNGAIFTGQNASVTTAPFKKAPKQQASSQNR
ncbi:hypothetical protein [Aquipseudomonas alcaligenes]|nr:hypothetical protein [Pseudomonas alcaligenes]